MTWNMKINAVKHSSLKGHCGSSYTGYSGCAAHEFRTIPELHENKPPYGSKSAANKKMHRSREAGRKQIDNHFSRPVDFERYPVQTQQNVDMPLESVAAIDTDSLKQCCSTETCI
jgi:hypothetical protein